MGDANKSEALPWMEGALRFCEDARAGGWLKNGHRSEYFRPGAVAANYNVFAVRGHSSARMATRANSPVKAARHCLPGPDGKPDPTKGFQYVLFGCQPNQTHGDVAL